MNYVTVTVYSNLNSKQLDMVLSNFVIMDQICGTPFQQRLRIQKITPFQGKHYSRVRIG